MESGVDATDEFVVITMSLPVLNDAPEVALELLHLSMEHPNWDQGAVNLAKQSIISTFRHAHSCPINTTSNLSHTYSRANQKSLENASELRLASAMLGEDHRLMDPTPSEVEALTEEGMMDIVLQMMNTEKMEVTFVGDFDLERMQQAALKYLGTLDNPVRKSDYLETEKPIQFCTDVGADRHQVWHLQDSDERAVGYICGPAPSFWGPFGSTKWPPMKVDKVSVLTLFVIGSYPITHTGGATRSRSGRSPSQCVESSSDQVCSESASALSIRDDGVAKRGHQFASFHDSERSAGSHLRCHLQT